MKNKGKDLWVRQVEGALKHYWNIIELERHAASQWPATKELILQGITLVGAIRRILNRALDSLEMNYPEESGLLRERYIRGYAIEAMVDKYGVDRSSLHRLRSKLVKELAIIIAEFNRKAERRVRFERFKVRHTIFGFEELVEELAAHLIEQSTPAVVVLEGLGGLGKTTLAKLIALHFVDNDSFVRVLWTSAKKVELDVWSGKQRDVRPSPVNSIDILHQLAEELNIEIHSNRAILQAEVVAYCKRSPYLIVLDNLETIEDMEALAPLVEMLVGPSRILITTRDRAIEALPPALVRSYVKLSELSANNSYNLLRSAAIYIKAPMLAQASDIELAQIYQVVGGNPLALWLVAGQAHGVPWSTFIQELIAHCPPDSKGYELYDYLYRRSWKLLSPIARKVLFAMHRCAAGTDYDQLHKLSRLEQPSFNNALEELEHRMLLQFDGVHYSIHRLTYTFLRAGVMGWWE